MDGDFLETMMSSRYATRLSQLAPFKVMEILARANELASAGHPVIHMEVGEPDFDTPNDIVGAGHQALEAGFTRYTDANGIAALREAISEHYQSQFGVHVEPERIFVTAGGSGALLLASALLLNHGEGLLMTDPGYPCNRHFLTAFHAEGQLVSVTAADNYQLTATRAAEHWQENTRGVLLASPSNPTGTVIRGQQLDDLIAEVQRRKGFLVMDEIYQGLVYSPLKPETVLQHTDDVFVINSFSKYFGMTGWRLGWLVVPEDAVTTVSRLAQNLFICPSAIAQQAALSAFGADARNVMESQRHAFQQRRDFLVPALRDLGLLVDTDPQGAFYVYAHLPDGLPDAETFCRHLLESHYVACTPGTDFGFYKSDRHVRISYAQDLTQLEQAAARIRLAMTELSP